MDAVASIGTTPVGNFPVKRDGSPIFVCISPDQNNKDIISPTTRFDKIVFDIVYI